MKIINIIFLVLISAALGEALWLLTGYPTIETGLLMITIFIACSEILLWKTLFNIDNRTAIGFVRIKNKMSNLRSDLNNRFNNIENLIKGEGKYYGN